MGVHDNAGWVFMMGQNMHGVVIGATALCGALYFKRKSSQEIISQLKKTAIQIEQSMIDQKWKIVDQIANNQNQNIGNICQDVDYEINQTYQQKLEELMQIDSIVDQGAQLEALSKMIGKMRVEVNP